MQSIDLVANLFGHATDAARGHDFRYLAEHDLMAIVQHVRQSAQLDQHFDEAHVPVQIEQALYPKDPQTGDPLSPCYEPLREVIEQELRDTSKETLEDMALASEKVQRSLDGAEIRKIIVVPDRLVNIVT